MQSRRMSLLEVCVSTGSTGLTAGLANYYILPLLWHLHTSASDSAQMAVFFAALSIAVKYLVRRFFNKLRS